MMIPNYIINLKIYLAIKQSLTFIQINLFIIRTSKKTHLNSTKQKSVYYKVSKLGIKKLR